MLNRLTLSIFAVVCGIGLMQNAHAVDEGKTAAASTNSKTIILNSIAIAQVADLDFGESWRGAAATTVAPASGANFTVTADGGHGYSITLPSSVTMLTGDGVGATKQIVVNSFLSTPSGSGTVNGSHAADGSGTGTQTLRVGATRAAIATNQVFGDYTASFQVTVSY